jgi:hypothetical protein
MATAIIRDEKRFVGGIEDLIGVARIDRDCVPVLAGAVPEMIPDQPTPILSAAPLIAATPNEGAIETSADKDRARAVDVERVCGALRDARVRPGLAAIMIVAAMA